MFSFFVSWWVSTYIYFSLTWFIACSNYSLRHIFSSLLSHLAVNQSVMSSFRWKHWSVKCYGWSVGFSCSSLLCLRYWRGVASLYLLKSFVDPSSYSPIELGLKLSTQKRVLWIFWYIGYIFRFMKFKNFYNHTTTFITKLWELSKKINIVKIFNILSCGHLHMHILIQIYNK